MNYPITQQSRAEQGRTSADIIIIASSMSDSNAYLDDRGGGGGDFKNTFADSKLN